MLWPRFAVIPKRPGVSATCTAFVLGCSTALSGCSTAGSTWMAEPLPGSENSLIESEAHAPPLGSTQRASTWRTEPASVPPQRTSTEPRARLALDESKRSGRVLGKFRNTYYDFPSEADYGGENVALMDGRCREIKRVPKEFHDAVCVQGSGTLVTGATVSFAKRDCECAAICPRTNQKICFDQLEAAKFPWGRGATGKAITPLLTVAVDDSEIPLGTAVYIPEFDGVPRDPEQTSFHDGCFIAQDRGMKIKGKHVDVFTGHQSVTKLWNQLVPSNEGVTVVLESARCARAEVPLPTADEDVSRTKSGRSEHPRKMR